MGNWEIGFDAPWFLALLVIVPIIWIFSFHSLAGLGPIRRLIALGLRSIILLMFILCLAGIQLRQVSDKVTVIYLLDQSESIPLAKRDLMLKYVRDEVAAHRIGERGDRAGMIVFGRSAVIEIPPFDDNISSTQVESFIDRTDATNLEAAMKLAQASFPEDSAKRIVVVTDGNENLGNARGIAPLLAEQGVGIDVVPVRLANRVEVAVDKVVLPHDIRKGQPVEARVVISAYIEPTPENPTGAIPGRLEVFQKVGDHRKPIIPFDEDDDSDEVVLMPGKNVFPIQLTINEPAVYTYEARFVPENPEHDFMPQNNKATAFTYVRGQGRILLIEDSDNKGEFDFLVSRLQANNLEVVVKANDQLFTSLAELQGYDTVILANVPRSSGDSADKVTSFDDTQINMLVRNTQQMGCGIVMIGGPNSFGAGGWSNTELEKAMPVDFQIKNTKVRAVGALVLLMHASEMAQGNFWQKEVAKHSIKALGPMDYCGLLHWGMGGDAWLWQTGRSGLVRVGEKKKTMLARLSRMTPGDMPQFDPAMRMALAGFNSVNASVKHMIIISDGDPSPPSATTIAGYKRGKVQITTVAVGTHGPAGSTPLQNIATQTGGKYYVVKNPKALPRIYQREARRVARPLVFERPQGMSPQITYPHEIMEGINGPLPPITGFVMTTVKENPLVEVAVRSPLPATQENSTILAAWTYGLGRTAVLTTDSGKRWANTWAEWDNYDKFFTQLVRWSMRPVNEQGKFSVATDFKDDKVRVVVTALDKDDQFLNFLNMSGAAVGPKLDAFEMKVRQVAPGRYVGEFDVDKSGSYFVTVNPGLAKGAPIIAGVNVPYSDEYRDREANLSLLTTLAALKPDGGNEGKVIEGDLAKGNIKQLLDTDTFRHDLPKAISSQDVWPWVILLASCLFFADVFVRRVTISFEWLIPVVAWINQYVLRRDAEEQVDERMERLRTRKASATQKIDERRAAARFEPTPDEDAPARELDEVIGDVAGSTPQEPPRTQTPSNMTTPEQEEDTYTSRLLDAKKRAHKDRQ